MHYRPDIQVMRGVAVIQVVLFHLSVPGFQGGFLGVDMFFVISGYLMALLYVPGEGRAFFAKRLARIAPAYLCVLALTVVAAAIVANPSDFAQVRAQAHFALGFLSNVGFWAENSYFDKAAFKPLLHFWSLGVEMQFYLLVPLFAGMARISRFTGWGLLVASLILCGVMVGVSPKTAFFWLPFRLWEFLLGFTLARLPFNTGSRAGRTVGAGALCIAVLTPLLWHAGGDTLGFVRGHPGVLALLVASASAISIAIGLPQVALDSVPGRLLERLGDYSYALYLTHFPIITLSLYQPFGGTILAPPSLMHAAGIAVLTAIATVALHHYVERRWARLALSPLMFKYAGFAFCIGIGFFVASFAQSKFVAAERWQVSQALSDRDTYRCGKLFRVLNPRANFCELTGVAGEKSVMLVGDSHADALKRTFAQAAQQAGFAVHFAIGSRPLLPGGMSVDTLLAEASRRSTSAIVLHYSGHELSDATLRRITELAKPAGIRVAVVMPVPVWPASVPALLEQYLNTQRALPQQSLSDYQSLHASWRAELQAVPSVMVYEVADALCRPNCGLRAEGGRPLYFDSNHLTLSGSSLLRPVFERVLSDIVR